MSSNKTLKDIFTLVAATHEKVFFGLATRVEPLTAPHIDQLRQLLNDALGDDGETQQDQYLRRAMLKAQAALVKHAETPETVSVPVYKSWVTDPIDAGKSDAVDYYATHSNSHSRNEILIKMQRQLYAALKG